MYFFGGEIGCWPAPPPAGTQLKVFQTCSVPSEHPGITWNSSFLLSHVHIVSSRTMPSSSWTQRFAFLSPPASSCPPEPLQVWSFMPDSVTELFHLRVHESYWNPCGGFQFLTAPHPSLLSLLNPQLRSQHQLCELCNGNIAVMPFPGSPHGARPGSAVRGCSVQ